jgi:nitroreductase
MDVLECIATRRSIRRFLQVPVDFETMMTVVEAGSLAPSSGNVQDWRFVVVDDNDLKKTISEHSLGQECIHNAAFLVVVCSDPESTERHYGLRGSRLYTVQNCAAAIENMLLAAHALELGGVWVGAFDEEKIRTLLKIPPSVRPQAILAFGYPSEIPDKKMLRDLNMSIFFNGYGSRIRNVHRLFKDYSIDWQKRIVAARTTFDRLSDKAKEVTKETSEKISQEGGSIIKQYKEKIKHKIDSKRLR